MKAAEGTDRDAHGVDVLSRILWMRHEIAAQRIRSGASGKRFDDHGSIAGHHLDVQTLYRHLVAGFDLYVPPLGARL